MSAETEENWPTWSAARGTSLALDGIPLLEVFKKIQMQLEILHNRPVYKEPPPVEVPVQQVPAQPGGRNTRIEPPQPVQSHGVPAASLAALQKSFEDKMAMVEYRLLELECKPEPPPVEVPSIDYSRIEALESRLDELSSSVDDRFQDLSVAQRDATLQLTAQMERLEDEIEEMKRSHKESSLKSAEELAHFMSDIDARLRKQKDAVDAALAQAESFKVLFDSLEDKLGKTVASMSYLEHVVSEFVDHKAASEERISDLGQRVAKLTLTLEEMAAVESLLKNEYETKVLVEIAKLKKAKANKEELVAKADLTAVQAKAEQKEIERVEELTRELNRRITQHSRETSESITISNREMEQKIEAMAQWCFRQMRKEKTEPQKTDNADIGRIKCLVCDHVIRQNNEQDVVFSGPGLKSTMKSKRGSSPPRKPGTAGDSLRPLPQESFTAQHAKLVKLISLPNGGPAPGGDPSLSPRASDQPSHHHIGEGTSSLPQLTADVVLGSLDDEGMDSPQNHQGAAIHAPRVTANKNTSGAGPLYAPPQLTSALGGGGGGGGGGGAQREYITEVVQGRNADSAAYFKDLEGKYAGTGGKKINPAVAAAAANSSTSRPRSAPMKRVHTTSKLQAMRPAQTQSNPLLPPY